MAKKKMNFTSVTVVFEDAKYNYTTSVNPNCTDEEIKEYFCGKMFDVGAYPVENMQIAVGVVISRNSVV
jgi:hypothetical protein